MVQTELATVENDSLHLHQQPVARSTASTKRRRRATVWSIRIVGVLVIIGSWQLLADNHVINEEFTSKPSAVWTSIVHIVPTTSLWTNIGTTVQEAVYGFLLAALLGIIIGAIFASYSAVEAAFRPIINALNTTPRIALAPLFIIWFGLGIYSKVALAFSLAFFIVLANTYTALSSVDREHLLLARTLGYRGVKRLQTFVIPGALPVIITGLELGLIYAFQGAVAGEFLGGVTGIGVQLQIAGNTFATANFFAELIVLVVVSTVLIQAIRLLTSRMLRWHVIEMRGTR